ncbi:MAG: Fe-S cluster assembly protein SufD [Rhizobiaceae bacterium]
MNMRAQPQRTAAETAIIAAFDERVSALPGDEAIAVKRDAAVELLKEGLPTRHVEAWHYTDLRRLLATVPAFDDTAAARPLASVLEGAVVLPVLNGKAGKAPKADGVTVQPLSERLADGSFAPAMDGFGDDDVVGALNAAFVADGWFVDVADGVTLERPIEFQGVQGGGQSHTALAVNAGAGASVTVVERQFGADAALVSSISHLNVGAGANVRWIILQEQPETATHLAQFRATLGKDARLSLFVLNAGGKLVRQEIRVDVTGEGADFQLRGVNLLAGDGHTDVTMVLDHKVPGTGSRELVRNIVTGKARGVFQGRINVHQPAQQTDAKMACNTLLLSDDAEFSAKPELEIFADDVQCGHGATVTEINTDHLFYLMARGIDEKSARGLLVKAFVAEVVEQLDDDDLVTALEERIESWFTAHG